jgi:TRAP-type C4-dicarboxylate transport system permease small subunit
MHVTVDVIGRFVFSRPLEGTTEIVAAYYMVAVAYLPWAWIARNDQHIVAGMFTRIGPPRFEFWLGVAVKVVTIVYMAVFAYRTALTALDRTRTGEVWLAGTMYLPVWPCRWMLPIAGGLMGLYLVLRVVADVARRLRG